MADKTVSSAQRLSEARRDAALREALLPHVETLVDALVMQGMTRDKALRTIRWATHKLTRPPEAPERDPDTIQVFGGNHVKRG